METFIIFWHQKIKNVTSGLNSENRKPINLELESPTTIDWLKLPKLIIRAPRHSTLSLKVIYGKNEATVNVTGFDWSWKEMNRFLKIGIDIRSQNLSLSTEILG